MFALGTKRMQPFGQTCVPPPQATPVVTTPLEAGGGSGIVIDVQFGVAPVANTSLASTSSVSVVPWHALAVSGLAIGFARYVNVTRPVPVQLLLSVIV